MPLISSRATAAACLLAFLAACGGKSSPPPSGATCGVTSTVTAGQTWQLFGPAAWNQACALAVQVPVLAADERLAVLLVNAGGDDRSLATVSVVGTGAPSLAPVTPPLASLAAGGAAGSTGLADQLFDDSGARRGEALVTALREETITRTLDGRIRRVTRSSPPAGPLAAAALAPIPATRPFCLMRWGAVPTTTANPDGKKRFWLNATRAFESTHAAFYYTDEVQAGIDAAVAARALKAPAGVAPFWGELAAAYEDKILPALTTYFGPESDVDGNGKMIFLFGNNGTIGTGTTKSFVAGYFWSADIVSAAANDTNCPLDIVGAVGNQADLLYLMDPGNYTTLAGADSNSYPAVLDGLVTANYPGVMAHELQHNVNYNARFILGGPSSVREEPWLNEGLSMLSETVAGYGLQTPSGRSAVRYYLGEAIPSTAPINPGVLYHRAFSMTSWEGDPRGNYAAVQAYMQYLLDHASPAMTKALENPALAGKANVTAATNVLWETGFANFVTASMFSNEDTAANPAGPAGGTGGTIASAGNVLAGRTYNYLGDGVGPDYVPWHHYTGFCTTLNDGVRHDKPRLAYVAYTPLATSSSTPLRTDGWAAFATGPGSGGAATITVQSSATVRPQVVVVRYTGALPNFTPLDTTCP